MHDPRHITRTIARTPFLQRRINNNITRQEQHITNMARVYADVNQQMPRAYWDYDSVNISWGVLENYEVVRKIGKSRAHVLRERLKHLLTVCAQVAESTRRSLRASMWLTTRSASSKC